VLMLSYNTRPMRCSFSDTMWRPWRTQNKAQKNEASPSTRDMRFRFPELVADIFFRWEFRMRPNQAQHSPPRRGGVAAPITMLRSNRSGADGVVRPARPLFRPADHPVRSN